MSSQVLILSPRDDPHALAVSAVLRKDFDTEAVLWDTSNFPVDDRITFEIGNSSLYSIDPLKAAGFSAKSLRSAWWRRPSRYRLDSSIVDENVRRFCLRETEMFFKGFLRTWNVPIINSLEVETFAGYKPVQLATAAQVGLTIPKTIMSNSPSEIEKFWRLINPCIYKPFTAPSWRMAETSGFDRSRSRRA